MPFITPLPPSGSYSLAAASLSIVDTGYFDSGSSKVTDIQFTPSGAQAGDLLLALIGNDGSHALSTVPSGSVIVGSELDSGSITFRQHRMTLTGSEGTLTWTLASQNQAKAYFFVIRNVDSTTPISDNDGVSGYSSSTGVTLPSLTTDRDGSAFVHALLNDTGSSTSSITRPSQTSAGDMEVEDVGESYSVGMHVALEYPSTGSTGTRQWSVSPADSNQALGAIVQPGESSIPPDPETTLEVDGLWSYVESGTTGNNTSSGGELTSSDNQVTSGPDASTVSGQRPAYTASRQNGKHGWVFGSGTDHIKFDAAAVQENFDVMGCYSVIVFKANGLGGSSFPRLWAQSDTFYLHLQAGSTGSTHKLGFYRRFSSTDAWYTSTNDVITDGQAHIVEVVFDTASPVAPPTIRVDGATVLLTLNSAGVGSPVSTAGKSVYLGNREENEDSTSSLDRGFSGDVYAFIATDIIPPVYHQKTVLDELGGAWNITVGNPFLPSVDAQSFTVQTGSAAGTVVGTASASNAGTSPTWTLTGSATSYYQIDSSTGVITVKSGVTLPTVGTDTTGTIELNNGVGTDSATVTVTVVAVSALKYSRPAWIVAASRTITTSSTSGRFSIKPNTDGEDIEILAPSNTSVSAKGFRVRSSGANGTGNRFRNVAIIGGHYIGTDEAGPGDNHAVWVINEIKGDCWVEGVRITGGERQDGFQIGSGVLSGNEGDWYFQRVWIEHINGPDPSPHGDLIQTRGKCHDVYVDTFYGSTGFQGFFFASPNAGATNTGAFISNGDLRREDNVKANGSKYVPDGDKGGFHFYVESNYANGCTVGSASGRTVDAVWGEKYTGQIVGSKSPTTPPNRFIDPKENAELKTDSGQEYLDLKSGIDGFINVGLRPGGSLLADGPDSGNNFVVRGSSTVIGGLGYT